MVTIISINDIAQGNKQIWNVVHYKDNWHGFVKKSMPCHGRNDFVNDYL